MRAEYADSVDLPQDLAAFRRRYRGTAVGARYNGIVHLLFVAFGSLGVIAFSIWMLDGNFWKALATVPLTFIIANFVEYLGHRYPMHHRIRGMWLMFHRHALEHHQFFTEQWMTCRSTRDYKIVLFPPIMLFFYLGIVAVPVGLLLFLLQGRNVAWLYVATAMFYFLQYETLHFCYHLHDGSWIARLPIICRLREHHRVHHTLDLMTRCNFNITWPIADFVFGTIHRDRKGPSPIHNGVESPGRAADEAQPASLAAEPCAAAGESGCPAVRRDADKNGRGKGSGFVIEARDAVPHGGGRV